MKRMGTQRWQAMACLATLCWLSGAASAEPREPSKALDDRASLHTAQGVAAVEDPDVEPADVTFARMGETAGASGCRTFGDALQPFSGIQRYRGNVYRFDSDVVIEQIQMELAFSGSVTFYVGVFQKDAMGNWVRHPAGTQDVVLPNVPSPGNNVFAFISTGPLSQSIPLTAGADYAIVFAWNNVTVFYGRDVQAMPVFFDLGQVVSTISNLSAVVPPLPDTLPSPATATAGAFSMRLCFAPEGGACCDPGTVSNTQGCVEVLESECEALGPGSFFRGERTRCVDTVCQFGACCDRCGDCHPDFERQACLNDPDNAAHWTGATCSDPANLCEPITGACCPTVGECHITCEAECNGVYQGDATSCQPDICKGACCIPGFRCSDRGRQSCIDLTGNAQNFRGPGTTCATLPTELECGGACCFGDTMFGLSFCNQSSQRSSCVPGADLAVYRGDSTTCPVACPGTNCCGMITDYRACCLSDGVCVNTLLVSSPQGPTSPSCAAAGGDFNATYRCEDDNFSGCSTSACCQPDGRCQELSFTGCNLRGGDWAAGSPGVACAAGTCPTGACCDSTEGACAVRTAAACFDAMGLYSGDGTNCTSPALVCDNLGACCQNDTQCLEALTLNQCVARAGTLVDGVTCASVTDCDMRGACCAQNGSCLLVLAEECMDIAGEFQGIGVLCGGQTCVAGACCLAQGCERRTATSCDASGGRYLGDDTTCDVGACDIGACCLAEGCVDDVTPDECESAEGFFAGTNTACGGKLDPCDRGACCQLDCTCGENALRTECEAADGLFHSAEICGDIQCSLAIVASDPADCTIIGDARQPYPPGDSSTPDVSVDALTLTFGCDASELSFLNFDVEVDPPGLTLPTPITVVPDAADPRVVRIEFSDVWPTGIPYGAYTCVEHTGSATRRCVGLLPCDVNGNDMTNSDDILALVVPGMTDEESDAPASLPLERCDLDRSGACSFFDVLRGLDLLNGAEAFDPPLNGRAVVCPNEAP